MPDARVQRLDHALGAVLVDEPEADAQGDDRQDDDGVGALAYSQRRERGSPKQDEQWIPELPPKDRQRVDVVTANGVGPERTEPARGLGGGQPVGIGDQARKDVCGRQRGRGRECDRARIGFRQVRFGFRE
jgi:hypothetical protein